MLDLRTLCTALGFTAVIISGDAIPADLRAVRAAALGRLIEEFCLTAPAGDEATVRDRMAAAIVAIIREQGGCLPPDLANKGFTPAEIDRHWKMATALANVELNIRTA